MEKYKIIIFLQNVQEFVNIIQLTDVLEGKLTRPLMFVM